MSSMDLALFEDDFDEMTFDDGFGDDWSSEDGYDDEDEWLGTALSAVGGIGDTIYRKASKRNNRVGNWARANPGWDSAIKAGFGALRSFGNGIINEDADPFEMEYETSTIDQMEALMEDALSDDADGIDASLAADEMVSLSFGMLRGASKLRPVMQRLAAEMRKMIAMARRDPKLRAAARLAPLALRRTAVKLMRMAVSNQPITVSTAIRVFRATLAGLLRSDRARHAGLSQARMRARRHQQSHRPMPQRRAQPQRRGW